MQIQNQNQNQKQNQKQILAGHLTNVLSQRTVPAGNQACIMLTRPPVQHVISGRKGLGVWGFGRCGGVGDAAVDPFFGQSEIICQRWRHFI